MPAAQGSQSKLGIGSSSPVSVMLDFQSEDLKLSEAIIDANGIRGTRSNYIDRTRQGLQSIAGPVTLNPNAYELSQILEWIFGGTPSGSGTVTYPLGETLPSRFVTIDRVTKVFTYAGVKVNSATFAASQGNPLSVTLDLIGQTETVANAGTFPAISVNTASGPFVLSDLSLTFGGSSINAKEFSLTVNNLINTDRYFFSNTLTTVDPQDRQIMMSLGGVPYGDQSAVYGTGAAGIAVVGTFTNGSNVLSMSLVKLCFPRQSPTVPGKVEITLPISGQAYADGATRELVTTLSVA